MVHYTDLLQAQRLCETLAAPARVEIMRLVLSRRADSLDALAKTLHLSNGAITQHVKKLVDVGLIRLEEISGKHGTAKRCVPTVDRVMIDIATDIASENAEVFNLPIGHFSFAAVNPYCAIATSEAYIGERDDPRYFTYPERTKAALIYFNSGKINWVLPSPVRRAARIKSVSVSLELSAKPYGHGHKRDSAVSFFVNDVLLGTHVIDGEFADRKGLFTPAAFDDVCQYGKYKTVKITEEGSFVDGIKIGSTRLSDIDVSSLTFAIATENGVSIFGSGFGDYDCGLRCKTEYYE